MKNEIQDLKYLMFAWGCLFLNTGGMALKIAIDEPVTRFQFLVWLLVWLIAGIVIFYYTFNKKQ